MRNFLAAHPSVGPALAAFVIRVLVAAFAPLKSKAR
jgi:hypothetical protein